MSDRFRVQWSGHHCPNCGDEDTTRSRPQRYDRIIKLLTPLHPRRCLTCYTRFWILRSVPRILLSLAVWGVLAIALLNALSPKPSVLATMGSTMVQQKDVDDDVKSGVDVIAEKAAEVIAVENKIDISDERQNAVIPKPIATTSVSSVPETAPEPSESEIKSSELELADRKIVTPPFDLAADRERQALAFVEQWRQSWQTKDLPQYFQLYSEQFSAGEGQSYSQWQQRRKTVIQRPEWIQVEVVDPVVTLAEDFETAEVNFEQRYRASNYREDSRKVLWLDFDQEMWRIVAERQR